MSNDTQPEIRFPGFTDEWEQRKLGELATIVRGASPRPIQDPKWFDTESDVGWLRIADVTEQDGRIYYLEQHISKLGQEKTRVLVEPHLLLSIAATVGKPVVNYVKTGVHDGFLIFLNAIFDREFMFQWLEMFRPKWQKYGQPGSQVNLNSELVRNQEILIPNNEEQQKIGSFFKQLDNTIALHQRKLDLLKETKKGFLQKMFPKNGAKVPEIRFPGFTEDWEQRKLGDVTAEVFQGINTAGDKVEYSDTGTPILQAKHITGGDVTFDEARFLDKERYSNYFPKYVPVENDILFANIGTIGPSTVVRDESEFLVAWNILKITLKKPEIAEFIQLQLDQLNQKHYFDSVLTGNATKFVNKDEMLRTPISVPTIEEQKKVGAFFSNIQRAITLHQRKLDLLKETKKGFLQKMFV